MKFLIPTEPDDSQAILVKLSLEDRGHQVRLLFTADLPTRQKNSIYVDNMGYQWKSTDKFDSYLDNDYDVVWWSRRRKPFLPEEIAHAQDYKCITRENDLLYESITSNMAPDAWWINNKDAAARAGSKLVQLRMAAGSGLCIPVTLCSNDPEDIRYFLLRHEADGVVYKSLSAASLSEDKKITRASRISFLGLPDNKSLQYLPGIYQKKIRKKFGLKVICFGDYLVAAKTIPHRYYEGPMDWQAVCEGNLDIEPYMLPLELENRIRHFMGKMGLVFACLDFIANTDGDCIFLEMNEQGPFLWLEECNPGFRILDIFTNFLVSKTRKFRWNPQQLRHKVQDYRKEMDSIFIQNRWRHVDKTHSGL